MRVIITIFLFLLFLFFPLEASAKVLPQAHTTGSGKTVAPKSTTTSKTMVTAKLRGDRKALLVYFGNLQNATNVSYTLIYNTQGRQEGAGGSIRQEEGNTTTRELLFGTCSKNVCTYHSNITNMKLEVTGQLTSGKSFTRRFGKAKI